MIEFFIQGTPIGKERPRLGKGVVYTPKKTQDYEKLIGQHALVARNAKQIFSPFIELIHIDMEIYCQSKKSADIDNIIKCILDGMNKIIYHDDSQVVAIDAAKLFDCENEGVKVIVSLLHSDRSRRIKKIVCPVCHSTDLIKNGRDEKSKQKYLCNNPSCTRTSFRI